MKSIRSLFSLKKKNSNLSQMKERFFSSFPKIIQNNFRLFKRIRFFNPMNQSFEKDYSFTNLLNKNNKPYLLNC